jgi:hypothetical protein
MYPTKDEIFSSANGKFRFIALIAERDAQSFSLHTIFVEDAAPRFDPYRFRRSNVSVGILEETTNGKTREIWREKLVNRVCPLEAMVTDDGAFVVTFDTWFGVGYDPIVVYDAKGRLVFRHNLKSLDLVRFTDHPTEDTYETEPRITRSVSSIYWKTDGILFFNENQTKLIVHLNWGHLFGVRLQDGSLLPQEKLEEDRPFINRHLSQTATTLLSSSEVLQRKQGARLAGAAKLKEFIPRLKELLSDTGGTSGYRTHENGSYKNSFREYWVREAARNSLILLGENPPEVVLEETVESEADRIKFEASKNYLEYLERRDRP